MNAPKPADAQQQVRRNTIIHDRIARKYDKRHGEIFNEVEQTRLKSAIRRAHGAIRTGAEPGHALDFGCGSGNLTRHMLDLGLKVTAADVSATFLNLVTYRHANERLETSVMNGNDLSEFADKSFDMVATYSVLHHIPDYLTAVSEMARVCKVGGVLMIDHEQNEEFWENRPVYREFRKAALRTDWRKFIVPANYVHKIYQIFDPRHANEGDIHVWPDDHIEWPSILEMLASKGFDAVIEEDYLLFRRLYRPEVFAQYQDRCTDTKLMVFRKRAT